MRKTIEIDKYLTTVFKRVGLVDELNTGTDNMILIGKREVRKISKLFGIELVTISDYITIIYDYHFNYYDDKVEEIKQFFENNVEKYLKKRDLFTKLNEVANQIHKSNKLNANNIVINEDQIIEISNYLNISYDDTVKTLREYFEGNKIENNELLKQFFEKKIERKISCFHVSEPNLENETLTYGVKATIEPQIEFINVEFKICKDGK